MSAAAESGGPLCVEHISCMQKVHVDVYTLDVALSHLRSAGQFMMYHECVAARVQRGFVAGAFGDMAALQVLPGC